MSELKKFLNDEPITEGAKETIIFEHNSEPPKNYIWAKPNDSLYEYDNDQQQWISLSVGSGGQYQSGWSIKLLSVEPGNAVAEIKLSSEMITFFNEVQLAITFDMGNGFSFRYTPYNNLRFFSYNGLYGYTDQIKEEMTIYFSTPVL